MIFSRFLLQAEADQPLLLELWSYFYNTYIASDATYENLNLGGLISPAFIVIGLFLGLAAAGFAAVFNKQVHGGFVQRLLSEGCLSAESAKSLPELDCADKLTLRYGVSKGVNLRRVVRCREEDAYLEDMAEKAQEYEKMREENPRLPKKFTPKPFKIKPDEHHFYIPEDLKYTAEAKFPRSGNSWLSAVIFAVFALVALVVLMIFLPDILAFLDEAVGRLNG